MKQELRRKTPDCSLKWLNSARLLSNLEESRLKYSKPSSSIISGHDFYACAEAP